MASDIGKRTLDATEDDGVFSILTTLLKEMGRLFRDEIDLTAFSKSMWLPLIGDEEMDDEALLLLLLNESKELMLSMERRVTGLELALLDVDEFSSHLRSKRGATNLGFGLAE